MTKKISIEVEELYPYYTYKDEYGNYYPDLCNSFEISDELFESFEKIFKEFEETQKKLRELLEQAEKSEQEKKLPSRSWYTAPEWQEKLIDKLKR